MRLHVTLSAAAAALAAALAAAPAHGAQIERVARFHVEVEGLQTTKWSTTSGEYTDCKGTHTSRGEGTEVVRFASRGSEKIVFQQLGDRIVATYDSWDPYDINLWPGVKVDARLTRDGSRVASTTGGWCSGPSTTRQGPYDCGQRRSGGQFTIWWKDLRRIEVDMTGTNYRDPFRTCPVVTASPVVPISWTPTLGRLSAGLLFGKRDRIVVEDGDVYREKQQFSDAVSTTSFKITLVRAGT